MTATIHTITPPISIARALGARVGIKSPYIGTIWVSTVEHDGTIWTRVEHESHRTRHYKGELTYIYAAARFEQEIKQ